jgi:prepilin-type N-terminal cleavage/methylation domain-containing protein
MDMRQKQGFTLVELLVVMAIIAILAAIVVPNASKFIARARVTRALSEVSGMETAIMAMVTDAGRSSLGQIFKPGTVPAFVAGDDPDPAVPEGKISRAWWAKAAAGNMDKATKIYSDAVYDLLQNGRNVISGNNWGFLQNFLDRNVIAKLGVNYMDLGNDPWGSSYQIFAGPWNLPTPPITTSTKPVYFRKFSVDTGTSGRKPQEDAFCLKGGSATGAANRVDPPDGELAEIIGDDVGTWPDFVGFPADANKSVYIWSFGENMLNSQMVYTVDFDVNNARTWYPGAQDGAGLGGGDDINNWDKESSWSRFTN